MFTKDDFFMREAYTPPSGEKEIFFLPWAFGGNKKNYDYFSLFKLGSDRKSGKGDGAKWVVSYAYTTLINVRG